MKFNYFQIACISIPLILSACNSSDDDTAPAPEPPKIGVFIDAPVKGLGYQTNTQQGTTNDAGEFNYEDGEVVTFYLDGVAIGNAKGAAQIPVTELSETASVATILQTLDLDADESKINVTGIKLNDTIKEEMKQVISENSDVEELLKSENLSSIQADSGVTLLYSEALRQGIVAAHVKANVPTVAWDDEDIAGNLYLDQDEEYDAVLLEFNSGNAGRVYDSKRLGSIDTQALTWSTNQEKTELDMVFEQDNITYKATRFMGGNADSFDANIKNINDQADFLVELKSPLPMSGIEGKHLRENTLNNSDCQDRTFTFTETEIIEKGLCGSFYEVTWQRDVTPTYKNVISGRYISNGQLNVTHFAMFSGTIENPRITQIRYRDGEPRWLRFNRIFTLTDSPLQASQ